MSRERSHFVIRSAFFRRSLAVLAGLLLALVLIEGALRMAGPLWLSPRDVASVGGAPGEGRPILCLGDSNVYGLFVDPAESYPARLQARLDAREPGRHRVINAGVPGIDSRGAALRLEALLAAERPRLVLLTVGTNDQWAWVGEPGVASPPWYEGLRLVRLARIVGSRSRLGVGEEERRDALDGAAPLRGRGERIELDQRQAAIRTNVERMARQLGEREIPLLLVGYAADATSYAVANRTLAEVAADLGLAFIETAPEAAALAREHGFDAVFFPDLHPRAPGYAVIARRVHRALAELGHVAAVGEALFEEPDPIASIAPRDQIAIELRGRVTAEPGSPDEWHLSLSGGPPEGRARVALFGLRDTPRGAEPIALNTDPLYRFHSESGGAQTRFDAEGRALVPLRALRTFAPPEEWIGRYVSVWVLPMADEAGRPLPMPAPRELKVEG